MKCEKCNEREATFFFSCNINGRESSRCLCESCAREEGFGGTMPQLRSAGFGGLMDGMLGDMFSDFMLPGSLPRAFGSFGLPFGGIMAPSISMPRVNIVIGEPQTCPAEQSETKIPSDAGADIRQRRELEALRQQLDSAVRDEDYEKAAELRDRLKKLGG